MNDKRLVQGLLIGACIALLLGIGFTWLNVSDYKKADKPAARSTRKTDPEPAPDTPVEPAPDTPA